MICVLSLYTNVAKRSILPVKDILSLAIHLDYIESVGFVTRPSGEAASQQPVISICIPVVVTDNSGEVTFCLNSHDVLLLHEVYHISWLLFLNVWNTISFLFIYTISLSLIYYTQWRLFAYKLLQKQKKSVFHVFVSATLL